MATDFCRQKVRRLRKELFLLPSVETPPPSPMPKSTAKTVWSQAIEAAQAPERAAHHLGLLRGAGAQGLDNLPAEQARVLCALFSGSPAMSAWLIKHPEWVGEVSQPDSLQHPRQTQGLARELGETLLPALEGRDYEKALASVRLFRQREMVRIAARDLARIDTTPSIIREISNVAGVCLDAVGRICWQRTVERFGTPYHQDAAGAWHPTPWCVLGLGKLGGQELNYSSDVDVIFVYAEEGYVFKDAPKRAEPGRGLSSHELMRRLAEMFVAEVGRLTENGMLYRIDLRLRPEGKVGPLARSLASYENFYSQWGQTWERMMLIKARCVAGNPSLAGEFLEMVQSFRFPRSPSEQMLRDIASMKRRIEQEVVKAGEIDRNVKLGRGGIREIEFVVQTQQLIHAGRMPFLQGSQTLPLLTKLVDYRMLEPEEARALAEAYCFLRDVEHRLQMEQNLQTHTIPTDRKACERLAALMGYRSLKEFEAARHRHTSLVRRIYGRFVKAEETRDGADLPPAFTEEHEKAWHAVLAARSFRDPAKGCRLLGELVNGPGYVHVSPRTVELAMQLVPRLLAMCPRRDDSPEDRPRTVLSDPDRVLARLDSFVAAYGARALLYETWTRNPSLFDLLIVLFDRSEFLAEAAIRTPDLVDELEQSGRLRRGKTAAETLKDLRHGHKDADQSLWVRKYHQAELMRIGLRDILGLSDFDHAMTELTALAEACLQYVLEVVLKRHRLKTAPFAVVGLGKLGGSEIDYGSDLDVVFVAGAKARNLPRMQRMAAEMIDLLSSKTEAGLVFKTDARLRPDGEKGLLVNTLPAYEEYYRQRAMLWEIQAVSRCRAVAGNEAVGREFQSMVGTFTHFSPAPVRLACYRPDWKAEIGRMRARIEKERTPAGKDELAIKTGRGGLIDAEFLAQAVCLDRGWHEPNTFRVLERIQEEGVLPTGPATDLLDSYRRLRRVEGILRRWSYEGEILLPDDPAPLYRVAVRCGYRDAAAFLKDLALWRSRMRAVFAWYFA